MYERTLSEKQLICVGDRIAFVKIVEIISVTVIVSTDHGGGVGGKMSDSNY